VAAASRSSSSEPDAFDLIGLPRRYALDLAELERRYLERSKVVHPDRVVNASPEARARAIGDAMALNRAYQVLRRPAARAEHLLALRGVAIGENEAVPPTLLMEVLELREELDAARGRRDRDAVARIAEGMRARERAELARAGVALDAADAASGAERARLLAEAKAACLALRYVHRTLEALVEDEDDGA
jgi:molecular chaperone HscB